MEVRTWRWMGGRGAKEVEVRTWRWRGGRGAIEVRYLINYVRNNITYDITNIITVVDIFTAIYVCSKYILNIK